MDAFGSLPPCSTAARSAAMLAAYAALLAQDAMRDKMRHELQALEFDRLGDAARDRLIAIGRTPDDGLWDCRCSTLGCCRRRGQSRSWRG